MYNKLISGIPGLNDRILGKLLTSIYLLPIANFSPQNYFLKLYGEAFSYSQGTRLVLVQILGNLGRVMLYFTGFLSDYDK